jgi:type IV pilus assembly protein PilW
MNATSNNVKLKTQRGVTLVELMVSITIGMVIVLFISTLYLNSRTSYRINDDNSRMQEEGRAVMNIIGRNLMQAGFGNLISSDLGTLVSKANLTDFAGDALTGCADGFANASDLANKNCGGTGKLAFQVGYRVDNTADTKIGAGTDCNGQTVKKLDGTAFGTNEPAFVVNRFYLKTKAGETMQSLYCLGNGGFEQPLLSNVEDMVVTYGITTKTDVDADGFKSVEKYVGASDVTDWASVISVNVCLELSSPTNNVTPQKQTYTKCDGTSADAADNRLHTSINSVFTLRNNASVRNFTMKPSP